MSENLIKKEIIARATDPIYIGTGGYTIGRVDNTIVRDPITKIPKIPGSSLAGTWRYYVALEGVSFIKNKVEEKFEKLKDELKKVFKDKEDEIKKLEKKDLSFSSFGKLKRSIIEKLKLGEKEINALFNLLKKFYDENILILDKYNDKNKFWLEFKNNRFMQITCAGQDNVASESLENSPFAINEERKTGHCGHCIVCKAFGFSKKDISNQGMLFFSDLNILFFPVYTRLGVRWVTSPSLLKKDIQIQENTILTFNGKEKYLNLGWLNLEVSGCFNVKHKDCFVIGLKTYGLKKEDIVIVPDNLISQIINSNLEVRTSVSIDPITGAAKEKALFTSEAIPRGTIFYGEIRGFKREGADNLPKLECVFEALDDSKQYFNTLGIGGMTTRGFGRLEVLSDLKNGECKE